MKWIAALVLWIWGFKLEGPNPADTPKYIMVAAPHTSNWDFLVGILCKFRWQIPINFLAKQSLFRAPYGFIFRGLGGVPVDRSRKGQSVDRLAQLFKDRETFSLCIAPEGTRSYRDTLKTGFYHLAQQAEVPLILCSIGFGSKKVTFSQPIDIVGKTWEEVYELLRSTFSFVEGKNNQLSHFKN